MDQGVLVGDHIAQGQVLIDRLVHAQFDVTGAYWLKYEEDDETWHLYIVSTVVDREGEREAYFRLHPILTQSNDLHWIGLFDVRVVGTDDPVARALLDTEPSARGWTPWVRGLRVDNSRFAQAYVYKPLVAT